MKKEEFETVYYPRYRTVITAIARKLARSDDDLVQDLHQVGAIALFRLDVSKSLSNPDSWIRQAVKFKMIDFLRKNNPRAFDSLDAALENGDQLERSESGELVLRRTTIRAVYARRRAYTDEEPSKDEVVEELVKREERLEGE